MQIEKKLLILDLDETLIHASESRVLPGCNSFVVDEYTIYKRPYLEEFLEFCKINFLVAVWTSSSSDYADKVVGELFGKDYPLEFVFSRERCVRKVNIVDQTTSWIKDLKKVRKKGYPLEQVIIVDDTPAKLRRNYGNHIFITPFEGDKNDNELDHLMVYLQKLQSVVNVRTVEKRNWRSNTVMG